MLRGGLLLTFGKVAGVSVAVVAVKALIYPASGEAKVIF